MGCSVALDDDGLTVKGPERLQGIDIDLHDVGELTPCVAALCALADSPSHLRGVAHIRAHQPDRLAALATHIGDFGAGVTAPDDPLLRNTPSAPTGGSPTRPHTPANHARATITDAA